MCHALDINTLVFKDTLLLKYPFTKATTTPNDQFLLRPKSGRIRESLLYIKIESG